MGMDLVNRHNDCIGFRHMVWARILYLAEDHGWQPAGTVSPYDHDDPNSEYYIPEPWHGGYATNEGQMVTPDDAHAFADALEKACERIPNERIQSGEYVQVDHLPASIDDPVVNFVVRTGSVDTVPREFLNVYESLRATARRPSRNSSLSAAKASFVCTEALAEGPQRMHGRFRLYRRPWRERERC
jgi:hypothetical protein